VFWEIATASVRAVVELGEESDLIHLIAISPDGKLLASGHQDGIIRLWDAHSGQLRASINGHPKLVRCMAFSPDGEVLATGSYDDGVVKLWRMPEGKLARVIDGHVRGVSALAFDKIQGLLATGDDNGDVRLWNPKSGGKKADLKHGKRVQSIAFSPDGKLIAISDPPAVWDVASRKKLTTLKGDMLWIYRMAFSPNGKLLATGSEANSLSLWLVPQDVAWLSSDLMNPINALAFSNSGKYLAVAERETQKITIWDMRPLYKSLKATH